MPAPAVGTTSGSTSGPVTAAPVPGRLEASATTPAGGPGAASAAATTPAARPRRPRGAASAATSAGGPPDPPGAAAAEAGVPGTKNLRSAGRDALGDPAAFLSRADPGRSLAGPGPVWVNPLTVLNLGRFPGDMSLDMLVNVCSKSKIRVGAVRLSHKGSYGISCQAAILPRPRPNPRGYRQHSCGNTRQGLSASPRVSPKAGRAPSVGFRPLPQTTRSPAGGHARGDRRGDAGYFMESCLPRINIPGLPQKKPAVNHLRSAPHNRGPAPLRSTPARKRSRPRPVLSASHQPRAALTTTGNQRLPGNGVSW